MYFKYFSIPLVVATVLAVAGCDPLTRINPRITAADVLLDEIGALPPTLSIEMPTSGTATYTGYATGEIEVSAVLTDVIIADASLTANFGAATISGSLDNFEASSLATMSGSLMLSSGSIVSSAFASDVDGVLAYGADTITIDGVLIGGFVGASADALLGDILGAADMGSGYAGTTSMVVFAAQ